MKDAAQTAVAVLGDAVAQMQAAHDKPRTDPLAVMEAALREIVASADKCQYKRGEWTEPFEFSNADDAQAAAADFREQTVADVARAALAKCKAFYAEAEQAATPPPPAESVEQRLRQAIWRLAATANEVRKTNTPEFMEHLGDAILRARTIASSEAGVEPASQRTPRGGQEERP